MFGASGKQTASRAGADGMAYTLSGTWDRLWVVTCNQALTYTRSRCSLLCILQMMLCWACLPCTAKAYMAEGKAYNLGP